MPDVESGFKSVPGSEHPYQDRVLVDETRLLYAVADGVTLSSQGSGGAAADIAVKLLSEHFKGDVVEAVRMVQAAMAEIKSRDRTVGETTLTCACITSEGCDVANVGDSPAYLVREGHLHSLVSEDKNSLGYITQVIGMPDEIIVHHVNVPLRAGDCLILASDGVDHILSSSVVAPLVKLTSKDLAENLVKEAERQRTTYDDDKSVIVVKVLGPRR